MKQESTQCSHDLFYSCFSIRARNIFSINFLFSSVFPMKNKRRKLLTHFMGIIVMEILLIFSTLCPCFVSPFYVSLDNGFIEFGRKKVGEEFFCFSLFTPNEWLFDVYLFTKNKNFHLFVETSHEMTS